MIDLSRAFGANATEVLGAEDVADTGAVVRSNQPDSDGFKVDQLPSFFAERGTQLDERP